MPQDARHTRYKSLHLAGVQIRTQTREARLLRGDRRSDDGNDAAGQRPDDGHR